MDKCSAAILLIAALVARVDVSYAQGAPSPDVVVALNEGIHHYLECQRLGAVQQQSACENAIERFTWVLVQEPENPTALLFRALSSGRLALAERSDKRGKKADIGRTREVLGLLDDPAALEALLREPPAPAGTHDPESAEGRVTEATRRREERLRSVATSAKDKPRDELVVDLRSAQKRFHELAARERDQYDRMLADLAALMRLIDPTTVVRLIDVLANANVARIDERRAVGILEGEVGPDETGRPVEALRADGRARLESATRSLLALLDTDLAHGDAVRTKFFLGILLYRQGVPLRSERERRASSADEVRKLEDAQGYMQDIAGDAEAGQYQSFAALYVGLILPFRAANERDTLRRNRLLDEAERWLSEAARLDFAGGLQTSQIPHLVGLQRELIGDLRTDTVSARLREDLSLSFFSGLRRDTNVVLLGERTDLPRDISRERDFGFTAGAALDYTKDITDQLSFGFQARTSQLWNADVDEFDQQAYGGSLALQYEIPAASIGGSLGPVFLAVQYDYDYSLLGRQGFLSSHTLTPSVRVYSDERRVRTEFFFRYEIRNYFEPLPDRAFNRDGTYFGVGVLCRYKALEMTQIYEAKGWEPWGRPEDASFVQDTEDGLERYLTPFVGVTYYWDSTDGDEFDRTAISLLLGAEVPLPRGWRLDASAQFEWEDYSQGSLVDFHRRGRNDFVQQYGVALTRTFVLEEGHVNNRYTLEMDRSLMTVRLAASWTEDDSNVVDRTGQAIFSYDRVVYGLSVAFTIN